MNHQQEGVAVTEFYKAVDSEGLSFFPFVKSKRINWVDLIGTTYALGDEEAWLKAVSLLREGQTTVCTAHLIHGYADIDLAVDFGQRNARERSDTATFRIVEFTGDPVAELRGEMLLDIVPWEEADRERFVDAVKYGFRSVQVIREVPAEQYT